MSNNPQTFCAEIPVDDPKAMEEFQKAMEKVNDATNDHIQKIAKELDVTEDCAMDVLYLRSRSRWTKELEQKLIQLHASGVRPNMGDFE